MEYPPKIRGEAIRRILHSWCQEEYKFKKAFIKRTITAFYDALPLRNRADWLAAVEETRLDDPYR